MQEQGSIVMQIPPEPVGEITAMEAAELKALAKLEDQQRANMEHDQRMLLALQNHRRSYAREIVQRHNLSLDDNYNINDDSGLITRTHRSVPVPPPIVEDVAAEHPAEAEDVAAPGRTRKN